MESTLWFLQVLPSAYNALLGFTQSLMVRLADSRKMILVTYWFLVQVLKLYWLKQNPQGLKASFQNAE